MPSSFPRRTRPALPLLASLALLALLGPVPFLTSLAGARPAPVPDSEARYAAADERTAVIAAPVPLLLVSQLDGATSRIWAVPAGAGPTPPRLLAEVDHRPGFGVAAELAPTGPRLALVRLPGDRPSPRGGGRLEVLDLERAETRFIADGVDLRATPRWSPDGRFLLFDRLLPDGPDHLFIEIVIAGSAGDAEPTRLAIESERTAAIGSVGWTNDGAVLFTRLTDRGTELWQVDPATRQTRQVAHLTTGIAADPRLSPDRRWLAFADRRRSPAGSDEGVSAFEPATGRLVAVRTGAREPFWLAWQGPARLVTGGAASPAEVWSPAGAAGAPSQSDVGVGPLTAGERWLEADLSSGATVLQRADGLALVGPSGAERPIQLAGHLTPLGELRRAAGDG